MQLYLLDGARLRELREEAGFSRRSSPKRSARGRTGSGSWSSRAGCTSSSSSCKARRRPGRKNIGHASFPDPPATPTVPEAQVLDGLRLRGSGRRRGSPGALDEAAELEPGSVARAEEAGEEVYASVEIIWKLAGALGCRPRSCSSGSSGALRAAELPGSRGVEGADNGVLRDLLRRAAQQALDHSAGLAASVPDHLKGYRRGDGARRGRGGRQPLAGGAGSLRLPHLPREEDERPGSRVVRRRAGPRLSPGGDLGYYQISEPLQLVVDDRVVWVAEWTRLDISGRLDVWRDPEAARKAARRTSSPTPIPDPAKRFTRAWVLSRRIIYNAECT